MSGPPTAPESGLFTATSLKVFELVIFLYTVLTRDERYLFTS
jgi:hypothetical protein